MAELRFNEAQLRAINEDGKNILVSAAAGSGKTTVLTARVLREVVVDEADIDSFVIMTFTKAAAAHMREKIFEEIKKLIKDGIYDGIQITAREKEHLKRQLMKVHGARICTIDSLCMDIVRENFQYVDLDPGFRIADEAELTMLKNDVLKAVLEEHYEDPSEEFLEFAAYYTDKNDSKLDSLILTLYEFAQSHPEPSRWLKNSAAPYVLAEHFEAPQEKEQFDWLKEYAEKVEKETEILCRMAEEGLILCASDEALSGYEDNFSDVLDRILETKDEMFDNRAMAIRELLDGWKRLPSVKTDDGNLKALKEKAQESYKKLKARLDDFYKKYLYQELERMYMDMAACKNVALTLTGLTEEFSKRFLMEKTDRKIAGFSDISHYALQVLIKHDEEGNIVRDENGAPLFTEIADTMAGQIREIIVDEYQDTNRLQDALVDALSSDRFGRPNRFMVGDVKQSIYGFRMACPELFLEKHTNYGIGIGGELIVLGENYRSRKEVIDLVNAVFEKAMTEEVGGIDYTKGHALCQGRPDEEKEMSLVIPELHMLEGSGEEVRDAESFLIAGKIEELTEKGYAYSDIAILTRTSNNPRLERMLTDRRIPVRKASNRGFFESVEVMLALDLLRIVDNPYQDVPLAAVLLSPLTETTPNDLAEMKAGYNETPFSLFEAAKKYGEHNTKIFGFLEKLENYRKKATYLGTAPLIDLVLEDSGLYNVLSAMPQGEGRKANIDFLKSLAENFARGSYTGLFNFIRYVESMQKSDMDFGQAQSIAEDAVQMMTIHKSKGLEFPVVILATAGKSYNETDLRQPIVLDREAGLGIEKRNISEKIKTKTLLENLILEKKKNDLFAEELRLLYVGMTRAMEKLIVTGTDSSLKGKRKEWDYNQLALSDGIRFPTAMSDIEIMSNRSYMNLIGSALSRFPLEFRNEEQDPETEPWNASCKAPVVLWDILSPEIVEVDRAFEWFDEAEKRANIKAILTGGQAQWEMPELDFVYPYSLAAKTIVKLTASQLEEKKDEEEPDKDIEEIEKYDKKFNRKEGSLSPSERGNAYHKLFELLDFERKENITEELAEKGYLDRVHADSIQPEHISRFLESDLFRRMAEADSKGKLKREQQFVMGFEENGELRLLQGIIDAFFEEDGEIVLVDYKTNRGMTEEELKDHYRIQQERYAAAIQNATGKTVKEKILYSTELGKEIRL